MIPYSRYARILAGALRGPRTTALEEYRLPLRVSPLDVELTRMNNGRYVTLMDLGRVGIALRCGLLPTMLGGGGPHWSPRCPSATAVRCESGSASISTRRRS